MEHQKHNRETSTVDMIMLFGMPVIIALLCVAIWFYALDLNARLGH